jgi:hypothetical protein
VKRAVAPALAAGLLLTAGCGSASDTRFDPLPPTAASVVGEWSGIDFTTLTVHADGTFTGHQLPLDHGGPLDVTGRWSITPADRPDAPPALVLSPEPVYFALDMYQDRGLPVLCVQDDPDAPCDREQFIRVS